MNGSSWKFIRSALAASIMVFGPGERASAAVTFAASGGDLLVTIDSPISLLVTASTRSSQFSLNFENVYTTGNTDHHGDVPTSGSSTMTLPGGVISDGFETWSDLETTAGLLDPTDFYAIYYFNSPQTIRAGDIVTVTSGVITIEGFISRGGIVPDAPVTSIHLFDENLNDLSFPAVVPEPSISLLGAYGLVGLLRRRRR